MVSGPRCVQALLEHYGKPPEDLDDLIHEVQWPDLDAGSSVRALEAALRKRGVSTFALQISRVARLRWPHPVLLHLKGGPTGGRYVIRAPSPDPDVERLWTGLAGWRRGPWDVVAGDRSGAVLLTSPVPITHPMSAVYDPAWESVQTVGSVVVSVLTVVAIGSLWWHAAARPRPGGPRVARSGVPGGPAAATRTP